MALPASGYISLGQIQTEFGGDNPIGINEYYRGGGYVPNISQNTAVPLSGTISLSQFYSTVNKMYFTISSNQTNLNLRTWLLSQGWTEGVPAHVTINSGVYISSNSTATPALTINGTFGATVELINNGFIVGMGGAGGAGGEFSGTGTSIPATAGASGGAALRVDVAASVTNNGVIAGGGGGGGGGGGARDTTVPFNRGGGGGGGGRSSNAANSSGGAAPGLGANVGQPGTVSSPGSGGAGVTGTNSGKTVTSGSGGGGGQWGASGAAGTAGTVGNQFSSPASGGSAGAAVSGNANITWVATGTRLGAIT